MQHSHKLLLNSVVSIGRILVNGVVTLIATRIALKALGADDYGIFNLIAGVITLLSFINGALMASAQRFYSIAIGKKNNELLNEYFNTSLSIHLLIGCIIGIIFYVLGFLLFSGFLNVSTDKVEVAKQVYNMMIISSVVTVIGVPYSAIINAYEDMTVLACSSVVSNIVKLIAAVVLLYIRSNLLLVFTGITVFSVLVKFFIELLWARSKYYATRLDIKLLISGKHYHQMFGFIGWNTFGTAGVLVRNQGIAVLLNVFFGPIINTVYGIANQINSLVLSFASTVTTIFTPSIVQSQGEGNPVRMLKFSIISSKLSFYISGLMALPILGFTKEILDIWLTEYPDKTVIFCQYVIVAFLISQLSPGVNRAILAVGRIKWYEILTFVSYASIILISIVFFELGYPEETAMLLMIFSQIAVLLLTTISAKKHCGLSSISFIIHSVIVPSLLFAAVLFVLILSKSASVSVAHWAVICMTCLVLYTVMFWLIVLDKEEKNIFRKLIRSFSR